MKAKRIKCFRCNAVIPEKIKRKKDKNGDLKGRCPSCKRIAIFVEYPKDTPSTRSTRSTTSTSSTTSTPSPIDHLILGMLKKERKPFQSIGRGIHNGVFYIGIVLNQGKHEYDAVVTSDRKIYVDWGKDEPNQIKDEFGLNYREPLYIDCIDNWWSNQSIEKWYKEGYKVDIKTLFQEIVVRNKKHMIYEDEDKHTYTALDIMRTYFFPLFDANNRTFHNADPGSGKTNQLMVYRALSFNPISSADFSSASIYRIIESTGGTILIDDFDNLPEEQKSSIIQHIRANYKKFKTIRADGNKKNRPTTYNSYSHLVFNNVYGLGYDVITPERVITIRILKHTEANDITVNSDDASWKSLHDDLYVMALQYWKKVKESYDTLEENGLKARELELIKPILSIASVIDKQIYDDILKWYKELLKQEKIRDVTDDWEFLLLRRLWELTKTKKEKETTRVSVKDIADDILIEIAPSSDNYKQTQNRLYAFIGGKLKGYMFKGGLTDGRTRYDVYRERVHQVLGSKNLLEIVEPVKEVDVVDLVDLVDPKVPSNKNIDFFNENNLSTEVKPSQYEVIQKIKNKIEKNREAGYLITDEFLYKNCDNKIIDGLTRSGQLIKLPNGQYVFGGKK